MTEEEAKIWVAKKEVARRCAEIAQELHRELSKTARKARKNFGPEADEMV